MADQEESWPRTVTFIALGTWEGHYPKICPSGNYSKL